MTAVNEQDMQLGRYMIRWNRWRRESGHVLGASELLALGDLLRELDEELFTVQEDTVFWTNGNDQDALRPRLEKLLGMHPGSLDTSRRV